MEFKVFPRFKNSVTLFDFPDKKEIVENFNFRQNLMAAIISLIIVSHHMSSLIFICLVFLSVEESVNCLKNLHIWVVNQSAV